MDNKLKMWVMEEVLTDFTDGLVCVYAESEEQAWDLLEQKYPVYFWTLNERMEKFRCIDKPEAFAVHGAG